MLLTLFVFLGISFQNRIKTYSNDRYLCLKDSIDNNITTCSKEMATDFVFRFRDDGTMVILLPGIHKVFSQFVGQLMVENYEKTQNQIFTLRLVDVNNFKIVNKEKCLAQEKNIFIFEECKYNKQNQYFSLMESAPTLLAITHKKTSTLNI
ncbi:hypothetical protein NGRA_2672 [Nosema granulosis]|uniref:Uncharacterized protein n=1 Tax=Nosema granulosis TaxID=83296 RepID=A0A9P6GWM2_9MICR|nr:hypothetical protein NGRA_2672 [Nosema granulosis]